MPLKKWYPKSKAHLGLPDLRFPPEYNYGSVEENKNGLDALSERTEFTPILLRMAAGDASLGSGAIRQIAILEILR